MLHWLRNWIAGKGEDLTPATYDAFLSANENILGEAIRQGELRLQAQLQSALASDARAVGLASLQAAASAGLLVAAAQDDISGIGEAAAYISAALLLLGAIAACLALSSVGFGFVGNRPGLWRECIQQKDTFKTCMASSAAQLDKYLILNDETMRKNGKLTNLSVLFLGLAPISAFALLICNVLLKAL